MGTGTAYVGLCLFRRSICDEGEARSWNDKIKRTIVCTALASVATTVLPPILSNYFSISANLGSYDNYFGF